ncbi:hypothetical protein U2F26_06430 [Micromonospora sp. 4G57]|uniref:GlsB/YeaQ/YmgE family stress response membrane protein n=1 Tax=Micromonospora sicca TaxID=2202420 RepID=A0ABU5J9B7_9ACTN|nr:MULTISPECIES: hypothetical protein [unclassified Micromonospora]MDZ5442369.1 hypothetical protein [Micromonospora sp. 4G57]MDZ5489174.1 hypothetical protein [Micromonospora sp. 4G53]
MSGSALVSALIAGLAVGTAGRLVVPGQKAAPVWLTLALGVAAALLGSIMVRLAGADVDQPAVPRLIVQSVFAGVAVALAIVAAGRQRPADPAPPASALPPDRRFPALPSDTGTELEERS